MPVAIRSKAMPTRPYVPKCPLVNPKVAGKPCLRPRLETPTMQLRGWLENPVYFSLAGRYTFAHSSQACSGMTLHSSLSLWERVRACPCEGRGGEGVHPINSMLLDY